MVYCFLGFFACKPFRAVSSLNISFQFVEVAVALKAVYIFIFSMDFFNRSVVSLNAAYLYCTLWFNQGILFVTLVVILHMCRFSLQYFPKTFLFFFAQIVFLCCNSASICSYRFSLHLKAFSTWIVYFRRLYESEGMRSFVKLSVLC